MSSVNHVNASASVQKIALPPVPPKSVTAGSTSPARQADRVELSGVSHLLATLKKNDIRADKVADIRTQIQAGTYEDDKKLDIAAGKLLDDLSK